MAVPVHAVLTDPDHPEEHDIEIRHTDSFVRVRVPSSAADAQPSRPRNALERNEAEAGPTGSS